MSGQEFKKFLKQKMRLSIKQFALIHGLQPFTVSRWVMNDNVPTWALNVLEDWTKYPDLIEGHLQKIEQDV